jgi:hypothetical protein
VWLNGLNDPDLCSLQPPVFELSTDIWSWLGDEFILKDNFPLLWLQYNVGMFLYGILKSL